MASPWCLLVLVVVVVDAAPQHKHSPKFPGILVERESDSYSSYAKAGCTQDFDNRRHEYMQQARCGEPKDVFVALDHRAAHESVSPSAVWVKRCVGVCEAGNTCVAAKTRTVYIPVRVYNLILDKDTCMEHAIEEHVSCRCCSGSPESCTLPQTFDSRKCACRCPNKSEKLLCKRKPTMRWNPSKCACEERRRFRLRRPST